MRVTAPVIAVLVLAGAVAAQDAIKKEMAQLEGEWSMVSGEANGLSMPKETVKSGKRVAKNGETIITIGGQVYFKAKFSIDPTKKPKHMDLKIEEGEAFKGETSAAIYELDGDTLKWLAVMPGAARATEFPKDGDAGGQLYLVFKRAK